MEDLPRPLHLPGYSNIEQSSTYSRVSPTNLARADLLSVYRLTLPSVPGFLSRFSAFAREALARPPPPARADGWHVIDGTPQHALTLLPRPTLEALARAEQAASGHVREHMVVHTPAQYKHEVPAIAVDYANLRVGTRQLILSTPLEGKHMAIWNIANNNAVIAAGNGLRWQAVLGLDGEGALPAVPPVLAAYRYFGPHGYEPRTRIDHVDIEEGIQATIKEVADALRAGGLPSLLDKTDDYHKEALFEMAGKFLRGNGYVGRNLDLPDGGIVYAYRRTD